MDKYSDNTEATGYVYVLKNKCFKEPWLQIGHTAPPLDSTLEALSHELPHDFEVVYTVETIEHQYVAQRVHEALSEFRVDPERRFFLVPEQRAVESVRDILVELDAEPCPEHEMPATASPEWGNEPDDDVEVSEGAETTIEPAPPALAYDTPEEFATDSEAPEPVDTVEPAEAIAHTAASEESEAAVEIDAAVEAAIELEPQAHPDVGAETPAESEAGKPAASTAIAPTEAEAAPESASLDPYLVTDFGYLYIVKPVNRVQVTARVAFGITSAGPQHLLKECRKIFDLNPRQLQLIYYGWLETSDTANRLIRMELGQFGARRRKNLFRCPLAWVAECAFQIPGLLSDYRFLRLALGRWARYYDRTPFYATQEKRAKRGELERERQDFDVEKSVIEARLGHRVRPLVLDEYPPGWKPKQIDHGFDLVTDDTDHGLDLLSI